MRDEQAMAVDHSTARGRTAAIERAGRERESNRQAHGHDQPATRDRQVDTGKRVPTTTGGSSAGIARAPRGAMVATGSNDGIHPIACAIETGGTASDAAMAAAQMARAS